MLLILLRITFLLSAEVQVCGFFSRIIKSLQENTETLFCCEAPEMFSGPVSFSRAVNRELNGHILVKSLLVFSTLS